MVSSLVQDVARADKTYIDIGINPPPRERPKRALLVVDQLVANRHSERVHSLVASLAERTELVFVPGGEHTKSLESACSLASALLSFRPCRNDLVVGVGGGTITDVVSFVAQVTLRGLPLLLVPTTLLAQVDAAIGGKNGVNVGGRKNAVGGFYSARQVICNVEFLSSLADRQFRSGMAEVLKVRVISSGVADCSDMATLSGATDAPGNQQLVAAAVRQKLDLLADDPVEKSQSRLLNFGHTFAHFIEEETRFGVTHGEAVMLSMLCEVMIGHLAGYCELTVFDRLCAAVDSLMTDICRQYDTAAVDMTEGFLATRQVRCGDDNLVIPALRRRATVQPHIDETLVRAAWAAVQARLRGGANG
jgi:3-dehydroquinate synthase